MLEARCNLINTTLVQNLSVEFVNRLGIIALKRGLEEFTIERVAVLPQEIFAFSAAMVRSLLPSL